MPITDAAGEKVIQLSFSQPLYRRGSSWSPDHQYPAAHRELAVIARGQDEHLVPETLPLPRADTDCTGLRELQHVPHLGSAVRDLLIGRLVVDDDDDLLLLLNRLPLVELVVGPPVRDIGLARLQLHELIQ